LDLDKAVVCFQSTDSRYGELMNVSFQIKDVFYCSLKRAIKGIKKQALYNKPFIYDLHNNG